MLPLACGAPAFELDAPADADVAKRFIAELRAASRELSSAYVTERGLSTGPMPYKHRDSIEFDFSEHRLLVRSSDGPTGQLPARRSSRPRTSAASSSARWRRSTLGIALGPKTGREILFGDVA